MTSPYPAGSRFLSEDSVNLGNLLNPPRVRLRQTAGQSIPNNTNTPVTFTTEDYDTLSGHSTSSQTSRYVCQLAGLYTFSGKIGWTANATGQRGGLWFLNGAAYPGTQCAWPAVAAVERQFAVVDLEIDLDVNDYIELVAYQDSGGALSTSVFNVQIQSCLQGRWVGTG